MSTPFEFLNSSIRIAPGRRVVPNEDYQKFLRAEDILTAARDEAQQITQQAAEAYEARRLEGYRDGIAQANEEKAVFCFQAAKDFAHAIDGVEAKLSSLFPQILRNLLGDLGQDLSFQLYIARALHELVAEDKLTLKVHPSRRRMMEEYVEKLQSQSLFKYLRVNGDSTLDEDQATIETSSSIVVLDLQRQINLIESYVDEKLSAEQSLSPDFSAAPFSQAALPEAADQEEADQEEAPFRVFE